MGPGVSPQTYTPDPPQALTFVLIHWFRVVIVVCELTHFRIQKIALPHEVNLEVVET